GSPLPGGAMMKVYEIRDHSGLDALQVAERPQPQPGPQEVQLRIRAAALNYRDLLVVKGLYNRKMPLPRVPVSDAVGEVVGPRTGSITRPRPNGASACGS